MESIELLLSSLGRGRALDIADILLLVLAIVFGVSLDLLLIGLHIHFLVNFRNSMLSIV